MKFVIRQPFVIASSYKMPSMREESQCLIVQPIAFEPEMKLYTIPNSLLTLGLRIALKDGWTPQDIAAFTQDDVGMEETPMALQPLIGHVTYLGEVAPGGLKTGRFASVLISTVDYYLQQRLSTVTLRATAQVRTDSCIDDV